MGAFSTMNNSVEGVMIPARFFTTVSHLMMTTVVIYSVEQNILGSIDGDINSSQFTEADASTTGWWWIAMCCFLIQIIGMLRGNTIFMHKVNALHICLNFFGALFLIFFVVENWRWTTYSTIVGFFSLLPGIVEFLAIVAVELASNGASVFKSFLY